MDYIILDMEWNQPWPGSPSAKKPLPVQIRGEIIQIGAVRILEDQTVADEFQVLIKPRFYRRLNKRVSKLTGIQEARLKAEGIPFPEAMEQFRAWCGEDVAFLTWGFDDIAILQENLALFQLPADWPLVQRPDDVQRPDRRFQLPESPEDRPGVFPDPPQPPCP